MQHNPRLAAARADVAAAEEARRAVDNLRIPDLIERELPYRRKQAALGVSAAAAGLDREERDTTYAVTRNYFTVQFAREQERLARAVVDRLAATQDTAKRLLDEGAKEVTATDVKRAQSYLRQAQTRQIQAAQGIKRALAALKEAIGVGCDATFDIPVSPLPDSTAHPMKDDVIALALARRGDLTQSGIFGEVTCLEVGAQGTSLLKRKETFASAADIHATPVPQGFHDGEYRPGAVAPEMPGMLVGSRSERMARAEALHNRADSATEVARGLVALEAEDAYLRWEEASMQVPLARDGATAGDDLAEGLTRDYNAGLKVKTDEVINARVLAAQARAQYNQYLYNKILALADLERITAGGFCANLAGETVSIQRQGKPPVTNGK
jgi:outer membrane protein TolC